MDLKYDVLKECILDGEVEEGVRAALELTDAGTDPVKIFSECIQETLNELGESFGRMEAFLPDLMIASEVVQAIQEKLMPMMKSNSKKIISGRAVIGTAYGDLHDIGKNMVSLMMQVNGFEIKDLGVSVAASDFLKAAEEFDADLIMISGLMLPSLPYMKDTIDQVKENPKLKDRYKIMVGGGPVSEAWAVKAGADGYSDDAMDAVHKAKELLSNV